MGLGAALRDAGANAAIAVHVDDRGLPRHDPPVELAVYFVCLEAIQNATKHAGVGATATVRLREDHGTVRFSVEDDGVGFDLHAVERGAGLTNIADRIAAAGGTVTIDSAVGAGTRIRGQVPG
jgi:signal transduction histidine kinase